MILEEYKAVREGGAGILDFAGRGLIEVSGTEAVQFLNGLLTNDIARLENGLSMLAAFPNAQGRLLALVRVLKSGDKFLFVTDAETYQKVFQNLYRFTFAGDFKVTDLSEQLSLIGIRGNDLSAFEFPLPQGDKIVETDFRDARISLVKAFRETGFDAVVPRAIAEDFRQFFKERGAISISEETAEVLRVENGIPKYGVDMDETTVVLETGIAEAVSFNKGCYIGQEIIARIHFRGHVAKQLSGLAAEENAALKPNDELKSPEGKNAGRITSVAFSPALDKQIALAFVRYDYLAPGTELFIIQGEKQTRARVAALPLIENS